MNILFFGDVVGEPGRAALTQLLPDLKKEYAADAVIANVENIAHGFGITPETIDSAQSAGVDFFTSGNHAWKNVKGVQMLRENPAHIAVPYNVSGMPGLGVLKVQIAGASVMIVNLLGQAFMNVEYEITSPYAAIDTILKNARADVVIVDFHAEATGEKRAMSLYLDGRATLLVGTHTHVQTADEKIESKGLGTISDLGYCGASDSSLGMDSALVLKKVAQSVDVHLEPPKTYEQVQVQGIFVRIDERTSRTTHIERVDRSVAV